MFKFEQAPVYDDRGAACRVGMGEHFTHSAVAMVQATPLPKTSALRREDLEFEVLTLLADAPDTAQREMASAMGTSLGRLNGCLQAMILQGWIRRAASGEFGRMCEVTPAGLVRRDGLQEGYMRRKEAELAQLERRIESLRMRKSGEAT